MGLSHTEKASAANNAGKKAGIEVQVMHTYKILNATHACMGVHESRESYLSSLD